MIRRNRLFPFLIITLRVTIIKWPFLSGMLWLHPGSKLCQFPFSKRKKCALLIVVLPYRMGRIFLRVARLAARKWKRLLWGTPDGKTTLEIKN